MGLGGVCESVAGFERELGQSERVYIRGSGGSWRGVWVGRWEGFLGRGLGDVLSGILGGYGV